VLLRFLLLPCVSVELAEAEVAVGDEGTHADPLGHRGSISICFDGLGRRRRVERRGGGTQQPARPRDDRDLPCLTRASIGVMTGSPSRCLAISRRARTGSVRMSFSYCP
jgi:hypothetical protein